MNKKRTVFIKEILETATSAVFGLLWNYILDRKHVLVKETLYNSKLLDNIMALLRKLLGQLYQQNNSCWYNLIILSN